MKYLPLWLLEIEKRPLSLDVHYGADDESASLLYLQASEPDRFDRVGWTNLLHSMTQDQLEVLVCLYLGFTPSETVKILDYANIARYYNVSNKLRKTYRQRKAQFVD